jgi:hypothetical protein
MTEQMPITLNLGQITLISWECGDNAMHECEMCGEHTVIGWDVVETTKLGEIDVKDMEIVGNVVFCINCHQFTWIVPEGFTSDTIPYKTIVKWSHTIDEWQNGVE